MTAEDAETYILSRSVMKELTPKQATVLGGLQKGDTAALEVTGVAHGGAKVAGRVFLVKDAAGWKVSERLLRVLF